MYNNLKPKINSGDRVIIGLGDSYTQGVGAYSEETWKKHNGRIDVFIEDKDIIKEQYENSWVNQLAIKLGYKAINLGHAGTGNRAALKELYFHPTLLKNVKDAVVIYFLSGLERFDFINRDLSHEHHHFFAMWPNHWDKNSPNPTLWKSYAETIYNEKFVAAELMLNLLEAQEFCRSRGFRLIVCPAFDIRIRKDWLMQTLMGKSLLPMFRKSILDDKFLDQFDWSQFYVPEGYTTFMELLCDLEGHRNLAPGGFYEHFSKKDFPSKYITNCAHPSLEGHKVIADELYKHINEH